MNYQNNKYELTKQSDGTWNELMWPSVSNDQKIDFYANTAGMFQYNSGSPYVAFEMNNQNAFN